MRGGLSRFSIENLLSHSTEKLRRGTLLCSRKILVSKNVRDKRGGESHNFPSKFFRLIVPKIFVGESFSVSLISGIENFYASEGYVTIFNFLSKFFWLTVPKNFVVESFSVSLISGIEKFWIRGGTKYRDFPSKIFCLTVPKNLVGEPFCVPEKFWYQKMLGTKEGTNITISRRNFFVSQCLKIS